MRHERLVVLREEQLATAADWVLRLREPTVTPSEIGEWLEWCECDPENKAAFERMQTLLHRCSNIREQPIADADVAADTYYGQVSVGEWNRLREKVRPASVRAPAPARRSRQFTWALLAAAIATLAVGITWRVTSVGQLESRDVVIATTTGVNRKVELPDGTQVTVAAGSRLTTHYSVDQRNVYLDQGEAYFEVKKDPERPFIVHALGTKVTAVGTAFNVRAEEQAVRVAITEGIVDVEPASDSSQIQPSSRAAATATDTTQPIERIRLSAGHQVTFAPTEPKPLVVSIDAQRAISWVSGTLQFVDEPLSSVIAAVNRYHAKPIVLEDVRLGTRRFTGTVVADRVPEWLNGLPDVFPVVVDDSVDDSVVIRADAR